MQKFFLVFFFPSFGFGLFARYAVFKSLPTDRTYMTRRRLFKNKLIWIAAVIMGHTRIYLYIERNINCSLSSRTPRSPLLQLHTHNTFSNFVSNPNICHLIRLILHTETIHPTHCEPGSLAAMCHWMSKKNCNRYFFSWPSSQRSEPKPQHTRSLSDIIYIIYILRGQPGHVSIND